MPRDNVFVDASEATAASSPRWPPSLAAFAYNARAESSSHLTTRPATRERERESGAPRGLRRVAACVAAWRALTLKIDVATYGLEDARARARRPEARSTGAFRAAPCRRRRRRLRRRRERPAKEACGEEAQPLARNSYGACRRRRRRRRSNTLILKDEGREPAAMAQRADGSSTSWRRRRVRIGSVTASARRRACARASRASVRAGDAAALGERRAQGERKPGRRPQGVDQV